jgi:hypothetical protein
VSAPNTPFMFGVRRGRLTRRDQRTREQIAARHACTHVYITDPGRGPLSWFEGPNRGAPFDERLASAVAAELERTRVSP